MVLADRQKVSQILIQGLCRQPILKPNTSKVSFVPGISRLFNEGAFSSGYKISVRLFSRHTIERELRRAGDAGQRQRLNKKSDRSDYFVSSVWLSKADISHISVGADICRVTDNLQRNGAAVSG